MLDYTSIFKGSITSDQATGHFNLKVNDLQVCIGPKLNVQRFYASASLNLNQLFIRQHISGSYHSSPVIYNSSSGQISSFKRGYPGAGINIGYELPVKKNALVVELQCDYLERNVKAGSYNDMKTITSGIALGYQF